MQEPENDKNAHDGEKLAPRERVQPGTIYLERRTFERILVPLTVRSMSAPVDRLDGVIDECLKEIVDFFHGDRALLWELSDDGREAALAHYHAEPGFDPPAKLHLHETMPYLFDKILSLQNLCVSDLGDLPHSAEKDRNYLNRIGVRSFLIIPLVIGGDRRGALSLACIRTGRAWTNTDLFHLQRIGMVVAGALDRQRSQRLIDQRMRFETMLADLSANISKAPLDQIDREIVRSLGRVIEFFGADRGGLMRVDVDHKTIRISHPYYAQGIPEAPPELEVAKLFPWGYDELVLRKRVINLTASQMAQLPPEAEKDRQSYAALGVLSNLTIPLWIGERLDYVMVIHSLTAERSWPEEFIPRLRLLGELFVNALSRKQAEKNLTQAYEEIKGLKDKLEAENIYLREEIGMSRENGTILGQSDVIKYVLYRIGQVAPQDTTVLIVGETGTGKSLVAQAVHEGSRRRDLPMIHVNCAVLPANLIESELFGREKGAFTGAQAKQIGRFELAHKGTIFLDEIAELPVELQAKLLRVIDTGEFERLGSPRTIKIDVRIIAATNRNLAEEIRKGRFREDLFYRLNVFPITVPPLRQRTEDIPLMVSALVERMNKQMGKSITTIPPEVEQILKNYAWPGNVRELENIVGRAVITTEGHVLRLAESLGEGSTCASEPAEATATGLMEVERAHIVKTLEAMKWKIEGPSGAAQALGLKPSTLRTRMQKLNITRPRNS